MNSGPLYLVLIYLHPGQQDALRRYENLALPVFRRHGGRFERILKPVAPAAQPAPRPSRTRSICCGSRRRGRLEAVRRDPEMVALVPLRGQIVRKALLLRVDDVPLERYFNPG